MCKFLSISLSLAEILNKAEFISYYRIYYHRQLVDNLGLASHECMIHKAIKTVIAWAIIFILYY